MMKSLSDKFITVTIELKNDLEITGKLTNIDSSLNISLSNISVNNIEKYPQLVIF
jgi:U6 snRNA-associated Sm-like protein LSm2